MALFQHDRPELSENPLPPAFPGEIIPATKLHGLRLRQLQDLAKAYGIDLPEGATKNEILPIMATHERAGAFRQPPQSRYHHLHAELNHDEKIDPRVKSEREQRIAQAAAAEFSKPKAEAAKEPAKEPVVEKIDLSERARKYDLFAYPDLQKMCKDYGINCVGKSKAWIQQAIAAEEEKRERAAAESAAASAAE